MGDMACALSSGVGATIRHPITRQNHSNATSQRIRLAAAKPTPPAWPWWKFMRCSKGCASFQPAYRTARPVASSPRRAGCMCYTPTLFHSHSFPLPGAGASFSPNGREKKRESLPRSGDFQIADLLNGGFKPPLLERFLLRGLCLASSRAPKLHLHRALAWDRATPIQKRRSAAALHDVADIPGHHIFACVLECGGAPPLFRVMARSESHRSKPTRR